MPLSSEDKTEENTTGIGREDIDGDDDSEDDGDDDKKRILPVSMSDVRSLQKNLATCLMHLKICPIIVLHSL